MISGFGGCWRFLTGVWHGYVHWSLIQPRSEFWLSILILKVERTSMSFKASFETMEDARGSWLGFGILILIWYGHWSLIYLWSEFWLSLLILKVQRTSMSFKSSFGALEDAGGSWLGIDILILIWIWSLAFDIPLIWILALYLYFEGAKNIYVLQVLIWDFGGCWRLLTGVWHLDLDLNMFTDLWYPNIPNFGSLSWFWRCKEHPCPLSPIYGLSLGLGVPDWGLVS